MATARIRIEGLDDAIRALDPRILAEPTRRMLDMAGREVQGRARKKAPYFDGHLMDSIAIRVDPSYMPRFAEVGTNIEYGRAIEEGRPAGIMPPVEPLIKYARRKGMRPRPRTKRDGTPGKMPPPESVGWALAMYIKNNGTKAQPYLVPALEESTPRFPRLLAVMARDIEKTAAALGGGGD